MKLADPERAHKTRAGFYSARLQSSFEQTSGDVSFAAGPPPANLPNMVGKGEEARRRRRAELQDNVAAKAQELADAYKERLLDEADRLAAENDDGDDLEPITVNDLKSADRYLSRGRTSSTSTWINYVGQVASYVAAIVAGYFVNNIDKPFGSIGLVIVVLIGVASFLAYLLVGRRP